MLAERARKPDEWERNGSGAEAERKRSGERAELAAHNPLKPYDWYCKLSYIRILQSISEFRIRTRSSL